MKYECNNGELTIFLQDRIDSNNAHFVEKEIFDCIGSQAPSSLVADAENLEYISSAGLRIVLKLVKTIPDFRMINVSSDVYEIFDMTGFTELMTIEKAYRIFDVANCEVVGEGANGKIYRVANDLILKVYKDADSLEDIKRERELSRTAFVLGIPTAIPFDVVKVGDTYGSVFELLNAKSFAELLRDDSSKVDFVASETVRLAKTLHATKAPDNLPHQSDTAREWLDEAKDVFDDADFDKLRGLIESIPETGTMLHGDLHIKNIMMQGDEALLIDMDTLCAGHPIYELAFIYNAYEGFGICDKSIFKKFLMVDAEIIAELLQRILELYLETDDESVIADVKEKASVIGLLRILRRVIRIGEQDTPSGSELMEECKSRIIHALGHLDTLAF